MARKGRLELLSERHPETMESIHNYGVALRRLGRVEEADAAFEQALRLRSAVLGADHPDTLVTRTMIVRQLIDKSAFDAAITEAKVITATLTAKLGERDVRTLEAMSDLAAAQFTAGRISEGIGTYKRAYTLANETLGEAAPEAMNIGHEFAGLLYKSGRFGDALAILQRVLVATRKVFDDENSDTLATLHSIAVVMSDLGRNEEAIATFQYVLSALSKQVSQSHPNRLSVLNNLSDTLRAAGRFKEALNGIEEVVRLRTQSLGPEASLTLLSRSNRGGILAALHRFPEAINEHREVYSIRSRILGERHPETLKSLHNLAASLSDAGDVSESRSLFEKVMTLRIEILGPHNVDTVKTMRGLAALLARIGQMDYAKELLVKIVEAAEGLRTDGGLPDTLRRSYFATVTPAYKDLAVLDARLGEFDGALRASQLSKARTLIETSSGRGIARNVLSDSERSELSDLEFRIAALDGRIPLVAEVGARTDLEAQRNGLAGRFVELNAAMQDKYPAYREATELRPLTTADVELLIDNDTALLDIVSSEKETLLLWSTGKGRHGVVLLPQYPNLAETVEAYRAALSNPKGISGLRYAPSGTTRYLIWRRSDGSFRMQAVEQGAVEGATIVRDIDEIGAAISSWLVHAMPAEVLSAKQWMTIPDGPLSLIPIETLKAGRQWVAEVHDVSYIQSVSMLRLSKSRLTQYALLPRSPMLAVGDPTYASAASLPAAPSPRAIDGLRGPTGGAIGKLVWPNLPGSAREVSALATLFRLESGISLFTGLAASKDNILQLQKKGDLGRYRYVVFSTHGYLDRKYPDLSGIVLSQVDLGANEDGYLRTPQLASFDFRSDLVFISACDSGVGKWVSGEGIFGLPFALYVGGNGSSILTLWPVLDGSTAEFVERFFKKVKNGALPLTALSETKREFIRGDAGDEKTAPTIWAPFAYHGP